MSATNAIDFKFFQKHDPTEVLAFLLANGWSLDVGGTVGYLSPGSVEFDNAKWQTVSIKLFDCEQYIRESREQNCLCLTLIAVGEKYTATFSINEKEGSLDITGKPLTEKSRVADFSWFLHRLTGMFEEFEVYAINCRYYD